MPPFFISMRIRLYDPSRSPEHWLQIIRPGQYAVFILDAKSRGARDPEGRSFAEGEASVEVTPDLIEAERFAVQIVEEHPGLCCEVYDHEGKSGEPIRTIYHPATRGKYEGVPLARRQTGFGLLLLAVAMVFVAYDAAHDLRWMWGYIVGLKLTVIGGSFLIRGLAGLYEHRAAQHGLRSRS